MLDLALTLSVSIILLLAGGVSIYSFASQTDEEVMVASSGITGVINLGLIAFSGLLLLSMLVS
jgi:hypothetical protein